MNEKENAKNKFYFKGDVQGSEPGAVLSLTIDKDFVDKYSKLKHDGATVPRYNLKDDDCRESGQSFGRTPNGDFVCPVCKKIIDRKILEGERLIDYSRDPSSIYYDTLIPYGHCPSCYTRSKIKT